MHLAQFNIGRTRYPLDDPRMAEFLDNVKRVNTLAEQVEGFVWPRQDASGHAVNLTIYGDPGILLNLAVWENAKALERFVWQTLHGRFYRRREEWIEPIEVPSVMWWVPEGARLTLDEGVARLGHLVAHRPSDYALGWESLSEVIPAGRRPSTTTAAAP